MLNTKVAAGSPLFEKRKIRFAVWVYVLNQVQVLESFLASIEIITWVLFDLFK